eukprot:6564348-Pyramimonas_sp.AAC.1
MQKGPRLPSPSALDPDAAPFIPRGVWEPFERSVKESGGVPFFVGEIEVANVSVPSCVSGAASAGAAQARRRRCCCSTRCRRSRAASFPPW